MSPSIEYGSQQSKNNTDQLDHSSTTTREQQKRDALELAEVIYNIFKDSLSNATIQSDSRKDVLNAK